MKEFLESFSNDLPLDLAPLPPQEIMPALGENLMIAPSNVTNLKNNWRGWLHFKIICAFLETFKIIRFSIEIDIILLPLFTFLFTTDEQNEIRSWTSPFWKEEWPGQMKILLIIPEKLNSLTSGAKNVQNFQKMRFFT